MDDLPKTSFEPDQEEVKTQLSSASGRCSPNKANIDSAVSSGSGKNDAARARAGVELLQVGPGVYLRQAREICETDQAAMPRTKTFMEDRVANSKTIAERVDDVDDEEGLFGDIAEAMNEEPTDNEGEEQYRPEDATHPDDDEDDGVPEDEGLYTPEQLLDLFLQSVNAQMRKHAK